MKHLKAAAKLIEQANLATIGVDLYIGTIPADVIKGVMLRDMLDGIPIDEGMDRTYTDQFQVIVRDPNPEVGYNRAQEIGQALKVAGVQVDDVLFIRMFPLNLPVSFPRGDGDGVESSVRIRFLFADTA